MVIDHIFFISLHNGVEAQDWLAAGWVEGSRRKHLGQGTANRKFYAQNCFFEFLWIDDEEAFSSATVEATGLPGRFRKLREGGSSLGICLEHTDLTSPLFEGAKRYQPTYFPEGQEIRILDFSEYPDLPWLFCLPFPRKSYVGLEPMEHPNGIEQLTKIQIGLSAQTMDSWIARELQKLPGIELIPSYENATNLIFDHRRQGKSKQFERPRLLIEY